MNIQIERKQRLLKHALASQSRVPLLDDTEKALHEQYISFRDVMTEQNKQVKTSTMLCTHLLDTYNEYIIRLQKLFDAMNDIDLEMSPSFEDSCVLSAEEMSAKRKAYMCWAERIGILLREANEFPKNQIFFNQRLFYNELGHCNFNPLFTFSAYGSDFGIHTSSSSTSLSKKDCHCTSNVCVGGLKIVVTSWTVNNFDNSPAKDNKYPLDSTKYTDLDISSISGTGTSEFIHEFSENLVAVYQHLNKVIIHRDQVSSDLIICQSLASTTTRTLDHINEIINDMISIDSDEINSLIQTGNDLKLQLSKVSITNSSLRFFDYK